MHIYPLSNSHVEVTRGSVTVGTNDSYEQAQVMTIPHVHILHHAAEKLHTVSNVAYGTVNFQVHSIS